MSTNAETIESKQSTTIRVSTLLRLRSFMYRVVKRAFDIVFALVGCIGVVLLIPFVKISYLLTGDKAPIFLKNHMRIGRGGQAVPLL